jgi:hypothetical protein
VKLKGLLALALAVTLCQASAATQPFNTYNFAGLKWLTSEAETESFLSLKGYQYLGKCTDLYKDCNKHDSNTQYYSGQVLEKDARIVVNFNSEGEAVNVYVEIKSNANEVVSRYLGGVKILKKKYGEPFESIEEYDAPYSSSSMAEALEIGKADISTSWFTEDDPQKRYEGLSIYLSRKLTLWITYSSQFWDAEYDRRNKGGGDDL